MSKKTKFEWLDRALAFGPRYTLCLSKEEYQQALDQVEVTDDIGQWAPKSGARTHTVYDSNMSCIVCMNGSQDATPIEIAALLVHEAVHIWQAHCEDIGEEKPGKEQEAYAIQGISQELMMEYARRIYG